MFQEEEMSDPFFSVSSRVVSAVFGLGSPSFLNFLGD